MIVLELNRNVSFSFRSFFKRTEMFWFFPPETVVPCVYFFFLFSQSTFMMIKRRGQGKEEKRRGRVKTDNLVYVLRFVLTYNFF